MGKAQIARLPRTIAAPRLTFRRGNHFLYIASICGSPPARDELVVFRKGASRRSAPQQSGSGPTQAGSRTTLVFARKAKSPAVLIVRRAPFTRTILRRFPSMGAGLGCWLIQFVDPILHPRLTFLLEVTPGCSLVLGENLLNLG